MTISSTNTITRLPGTGGTPDDDYDFTFRADADSDVSVTVTDASGNDTALTQGTDYTISRNSDQENNPGGTVTLIGSYASWTSSGWVTMRRSLPLTQPTDFGNQGGFFHEVHEQAFDRLTMMVQQLQEALDRAAKTGETSGVTNMLIPTGSDGYLKMVSNALTLDSSVTPPGTSVSSFWDPILGLANASLSLDALGFSADAKTLIGHTFAQMLTDLSAASLGANGFTGKQTLGNDLQVNKAAYFDAEYDNGPQSSNFTLDWGNGNKQKVTLDASSLQPTFIDPSGPTSLTLKVVQGATGGTFNWSTVSVVWPGGSIPTLSTGGGSEDLIFFYFDGSKYYGSAINDFR